MFNNKFNNHIDVAENNINQTKFKKTLFDTKNTVILKISINYKII